MLSIRATVPTRANSPVDARDENHQVVTVAGCGDRSRGFG